MTERVLHRPAVRVAMLLAAVILLRALPSAGAEDAPPDDFLKPDSAKECAICHYQWVDTFFEGHTGTQIAALPERPLVAEAEMCFSCHDGSTVDSRKHVFNDRRHQVGITPSETITVPDEFPLDSQGRMTCATCHSAHGVSTEPGIEKTIFLRTSHEDSRMCEMCHADKTGGPEQGNHPVGKNTLRIPDAVIGSGGYVGSTPNMVICESCHVAHGGFTDARLVLPVDRPGRYPVLCETCHGTTPGLFKHPDTGGYSHSVNVVPERADIPEAWQDGEPVRLGEGGSIVCTTCHTTHKAPVRESLLVQENQQDSMCRTCHAAQMEAIAGTRHDLRETAPDERNAAGQTVAESGLCGACHLVHQGFGPFMWARDVAGTADPFTGVCTGCHAEKGCASEALVPAGGHPVGVRFSGDTSPVDFPLYAESGARQTRGAVYCSSCHDSHRWNPADPADKGTGSEEGTAANSFLRAGVDRDSTLCGGCHPDQAVIRHTDHDLLHSGSQERNVNGQTADASGVCGVCHLPHGGGPAFMWARPADAGGTEPIDNLCLECHRADGCAPEALIGEHTHPTAVVPDGTIRTELPLFEDGGTDSSERLMTCATCHDPHRWDPSDADVKREDGTAADSFLRQSAADGAALCLGCHPDQAAVAGTEHDLRVGAGQCEPGSGLCAPCHAVHNARMAAYLWNRETDHVLPQTWRAGGAHGDDLITGLCAGCHLGDGCAGASIAAYGLHPHEDYRILFGPDAEEMPEDFPLYADNGSRSLSGNIVCSTCHDAHVWDRNDPGAAPGVPSEGTIANSFLRSYVSFSFCAQCHGEETLYRFRFYHTERGRVKQ